MNSALDGVTATLEVLFEPGTVVELRAFKGRETVSGYFGDYEVLAREVGRLEAGDMPST